MKYRIIGIIRNKDKIYPCDETVEAWNKTLAQSMAIDKVSKDKKSDEPCWEAIPEVIRIG